MNLTVHFLGHGMTACQKSEPVWTWPDDQKWSSDWQEVNCPECLKGKIPIDTFTISPDGKSITCKRCKMTSYNPNDVEKLYCANCHAFHDDIWPPARQWWIDHPDTKMSDEISS